MTRDEIIEQCAQIADDWDAHVGEEIGRQIRALKSAPASDPARGIGNAIEKFREEYLPCVVQAREIFDLIADAALAAHVPQGVEGEPLHPDVDRAVKTFLDGFSEEYAARIALRKALDATQPSQPVHDTDFAWLIEAPGTKYLATRRLGINEFYWTSDHNTALRFISEQQADGVMMAVRELVPPLFEFARTLGEARPVEHGWIGSKGGDASEKSRSSSERSGDRQLHDTSPGVTTGAIAAEPSQPVQETGTHACLGANANAEVCQPSGDNYKRCAICGFVIDTQFAAEKPTIDYSPGRGGRRHAAPPRVSEQQAEAAVAHEREECAKIARTLHTQYVQNLGGPDYTEPTEHGEMIAKAIEARAALSAAAQEE